MTTTGNLEYNDVDDVDEFSDQDMLDSPDSQNVTYLWYLNYHILSQELKALEEKTIYFLTKIVSGRFSLSISTAMTQQTKILLNQGNLLSQMTTWSPWDIYKVTRCNIEKRSSWIMLIHQPHRVFLLWAHLMRTNNSIKLCRPLSWISSWSRHSQGNLTQSHSKPILNISNQQTTFSKLNIWRLSLFNVTA